jgi:hypothetical protein
MQELSTISHASVYNQVYHLQRPDYSQEVTEASHQAFVFVLLTSSYGTNVESKLLVDLWRELAGKFGDIKFCQMQANLCIEGYPEKNTPTVLVYKNGDIVKQIVTLRELAGSRTTIDDLQNLLIEIGAVKSTDSRIPSKDLSTEEAKMSNTSAIRSGSSKIAATDDDSDWD